MSKKVKHDQNSLIGVILKIFRRNFIAGLLVLLPAFTAVYVTLLLYNWIDTPVQEKVTVWLVGDKNLGGDDLSLLSNSAKQEFLAGKRVKLYKELFGIKGAMKIPARVKRLDNGNTSWKLFPLFGIITTLVIMFVVGLLARTLFGRLIIRFSEWFVSKIPGVSTVYTATKQIGESLFTGDESRFEHAVLIEYPRKGLYSIGFVTGRAIKTFDDKAGAETTFVFLPTTPNPTSGFLLGVPKNELVFLDMTIEDTIKMIISGGMIIPDIEKARLSAIKPSEAGGENDLIENTDSSDSPALEK